MKFAESLLAVGLLGLAGFVGAQSVDVRAQQTRSEAAGAIEVGQSSRGAQHVPARDVASGSKVDSSGARTVAGTAAVVAGSTASVGSSGGAESRSADPVDPADPVGGIVGMGTRTTPRFFPDAGTVREMRRRITEGASGTYIDELLAARDSALARWPNRQARPLRVWVDDASSVEGWNAEFVTSVREAFDTWAGTGIPLRFDYIMDSTSADVHVRFTDRLANGISGKTIWSRDAHWWLVDGDIELALVHPSGGSVSPTQMRAIALHEVGHLLGLDHAASAENIMSARVRVRELSETDRATIRLLYSMRAGSIK